MPVQAASARTQSPSLTSQQFQLLQQLLQRECGVQLPSDRSSMVVSRLRPRLSATGCTDFDDYLGLLQVNPAEKLTFIDALTTHETYFFRERSHFEHMMIEVEQRHLANAKIWSAACSMGHEAYTAAMLMNEYASGGHWHITGTDIALDTLNKAKRGEYNCSEKSRIFERLYQISCSEEPSHKTFRFNDQILQKVRFEHFNLMHRFKANNFDFIFLRNVLIYFTDSDQKRIVNNVLQALKPGGIVYFGHSEQLAARNMQLEKVGVGAWRKGRSSTARNGEMQVFSGAVTEEQKPALVRGAGINHQTAGLGLVTE